MNKKLIYSGLLLASLGLGSCDNFFSMRTTDERTTDYLMLAPKTLLQGYIDYAYLQMSTTNFNFWNSSGYVNLDVATDNGVGRYTDTSMEKMATMGSAYWTKDVSPLNSWTSYYQKIRNVNDFLENYHYIEYDTSAVTAQDLLDRESWLQRSMGEAYFLRAMNHFELMRRHSGIDINGELMGVPYMFNTMPVDELEYLPRDTFDDCIKYVLADCDEAIARLPWDYDDVAQNGLTATSCNRSSNYGRATIMAAKALKSRATLYAASAAYNLSSDVTRYEDAAAAAWDVIDYYGTTLPDVYDISNLGVSSGDNLGENFYNDDETEETIFVRLVNSDTTTGSANQYPPGIYYRGEALNNPSQNLVDAFPMQNGYPITDLINSGYDRDGGNQYVGRDVRFYMTVLHNKQTFQGYEIQNYPGGRDYYGADYVGTTDATRTGYFLRKWTSSKVYNWTSTTIGARHPNVAIFRKVEIFLNLAEASLEAYGIDGRGSGIGMSAREAIAEVRARAGIGTNRAGIDATIATDEYLASITSVEDMRELIRNERRIELCFEEFHRFMDLRRWKVSLDELNTPVKGIFFDDENDNVGTIKTITIDGGGDYVGKYEDYMYYGPVPNTEVLKDSELTQNAGW